MNKNDNTKRSNKINNYNNTHAHTYSGRDPSE